MGNRFLGGSSPAVNEKSAQEAAQQVGRRIEYRVRFVRDADGRLREDRAYNSQQRLDAFAGRPVVRRSEYVAIDRGGETSRLNTLTYFKGGLVGKAFSLRRRSQAAGPDAVVADELTRQIYARRCEQSEETRVCPPPIVTDQESVTEYRRMPDGTVEGRVRLLGYLNPTDLLYFAAERRAVTVSDYRIRLARDAAADPAGPAAATAPTAAAAPAATAATAAGR